MTKQANVPFPKEEFRKEFIVNILIGFIVAEATILYFLGNIDSSYFTVTAIPFIFLYFISKIGFYKHSFFWTLLLIYMISLTPFLTRNGDVFSAVISLSLLTILIYSLLGTWQTLPFIFTIILTAVALKKFDAFEQNGFESMLRYLFFPLATGVTLCVGWLPNQRIKEALRKIRNSEYRIRMERNTLDIRLRERTESLFKLAELGSETKSLVHDISTPLNIMIMNISQITLNDVEKTQKAITRAQYGAQTMANFVEEVKSKIRGQDNKTWFEIPKVIEVTKHICETENTKVVHKYSEKLVLYGNESKFLQMVVNIVQNSVEAYEERKGTVQVKSYRTSKEVIITITDKGKGIDPELLKNMGSFTTKKDSTLNGIGYHTAREIAESDFNGNITTKSTTGKGTKTTIQIRSPARPESDRARLP